MSPSTLKVYIASIGTNHDAVEGKSLGKHDLVVRFLRGARRINPLYTLLGFVSGPFGTSETTLCNKLS